MQVDVIILGGGLIQNYREIDSKIYLYKDVV